MILGDGRETGLPRSAFDVATARLVLVNVPRPEEIVDEAVALVRPGGAVAFHEFDWVASLCDPPCDEWSRAVELLDAYSWANGTDLYIGRRLPRLLREAGLEDVQVRPLVHAYPPGRTVIVHPGRGFRLMRGRAAARRVAVTWSDLDRACAM